MNVPLRARRLVLSDWPRGPLAREDVRRRCGRGDVLIPVLRAGRVKQAWFVPCSSRAAVFALAALACNDTPAFEFGLRSSSPCEGVCVAEPALHCITRDGCQDSSECPSGTACTSTGAGPGTCQVVDQENKPPNRLLNGFDAERFRLTAVQGDEAANATFEWEAPNDASRVSCALFTCLPEIVEVDGSKRIVNFDQCVIAWDVFNIRASNPGSALFTLAENVGNEYIPAGEVDRCRGITEAPRSRNVTHLAVGCWSYESTSLSGATRLLYVKPPQVASYEEIPKEASCSADHAQCYEAGQDFFGVCLQGSCRRRCMDDRDCVERAQLSDLGSSFSEDAGGSDAGAAAPLPRCIHSSDLFLGACMPAENTAN